VINIVGKDLYEILIIIVSMTTVFIVIIILTIHLLVQNIILYGEKYKVIMDYIGLCVQKINYAITNVLNIIRLFIFLDIITNYYTYNLYNKIFLLENYFIMKKLK
jgi:hypothetical protein